MKISARNQIKGKIVAVEEGPISGQVTIDIGGGNHIVAHITEDSVEALGLNDGDDVVAIIKASSILVGK